MGRRMAMTQKANNLLKKKFESMNVTRCEVCGNGEWLTFMHRQKRRHYLNAEALSDIKEVILACMSCHQRLEYDREATEAVFRRLRG